MTNPNNAAQAAINAVPSTFWWHPDGYTINNNFSGEDLILRSAALDALSKLRAEGVQAGDTISVNERTALTALVECASWAFHAADDGEDDGTDTIKVPRHTMQELDAALDKMDTLPDDMPGCTMGPSGRAEWALRRFFSGTTIMGQEQRQATPVVPDDEAISESWVSACDQAGIAYDGPSFERGYRLGEIAERDRAALASAPVAGEAQKPMVWLLETTPDGYALHRSFDFNEPPRGFPGLVRKTPLYAAQQASQAVRILFPTHLRKMWSGGEVQAWLDNHQGITPPTASAKGSLERYRDWRAEQAEADKDGVRSEGHQ